MKVKRVLHIRAPLVIRTLLSRKRFVDEVVPTSLGNFGGTTVVLEGDTDHPGFVTMRVARCRFNDNYNRKMGLKIAHESDPMVVPLRKLASTIREEEEHMLKSCIPILRRDKETLDICCSDYDRLVRQFLPLPPKEYNNDAQ